MLKYKNIVNSAAYWLLPQGVAQILRLAINSLEGKKSKKSAFDYDTNGLATLKNKHKGERCFILATGPSVQTQDLSVLAGELCIAVSHFFLHKDIRLISPRYHVLAPYHSPFTFSDIKKVFDGFSERYSDEVTYVFGHRPYKYSVFNFLKQFPDYMPKEYFFVDYTLSRPLSDDNYKQASSWDITSEPFQIRTVIYSAIQLGVYLGCQEIYLVGCDHDYLQDTKRVSNHHFYPEHEGVSDVEHLSCFTTERWFEEYYFRWKQYRLMREHLNNVGCKIFNATKGGMLDVFQRIDLPVVINK